MMEISYILVGTKLESHGLMDEDYQERPLYDVKERSMLRIERAAVKHYSFLRKDVPVGDKS